MYMIIPQELGQVKGEHHHVRQHLLLCVEAKNPIQNEVKVWMKHLLAVQHAMKGWQVAPVYIN